MKKSILQTVLMASSCIGISVMTSSVAATFDIPGGDLKSALDAYARQTGVSLVYSGDAVKGIRTRGVKGQISTPDALLHLLEGTGFTIHTNPDSAITIVRSRSSEIEIPSMQLAQAAPPRTAVETVTVTSSKLGGADVQSIPIAITALSQEQLTATQTAGGPDLVKQVPNLTFTKTNFTGYSINIRGIGTQAISVTTDPAVAVAFNDMPFLRNHFFEQEFYDVAQVEVLRGPQGTLYGRNATAGVVNLTSAKPSDQFEAMASAELGNYHQHRFEGMINLPIVDDRLDIRAAGEWTKRQGYSFNDVTGSRIDGRDLWSSRVSIALKPFEGLQATLVWEHFSENDNRMRTAKQLCHRQPIAALLGGDDAAQVGGTSTFAAANYGSQGCQMSSLYSPEAFEVPNGFSLPYYFGLIAVGSVPGIGKDPYASRTQSTNLRVIETAFNPEYRVKNDIVELNTDYTISPELAFTSQTAFNNDFLWSLEDYNRFNTAPGIFAVFPGDTRFTSNGTIYCLSEGGTCVPLGIFCDPQMGCSDRLVAEDLSTERAWQFSQEFRLASNFSGPFNFSAGGNYLHYETDEDYYVFINTLTIFEAASGMSCGFQGGCTPYAPGYDNSACLKYGKKFPDLTKPHDPFACGYIDANPVTELDGNGHNYFRSQNPYILNSYAAFGEAYYSVLSNLKLTAGLRWTEDRKHFTEIPSELLVDGWGYPITGVVNQVWDQFTGRFAANWTPELEFTDQTIIYGSYAHGYKAGGANPPGAILLTYGNGPDDEISTPVHPRVFKPEFVDAFEVGTKNTLLDGALTLNASAFYYNYENYQISEIVDRTSINLNFDAHAKGAELEATWEPLPGLRFNFAGGYEDARLAKGSKSVDLMDRTAGNTDWMVIKPFVTQASNCILPVYVVLEMVAVNAFDFGHACGAAYAAHLDPVTERTYEPFPTTGPFFGTPLTDGYPGFDPLSVDPSAPADVNNGLGLPPNSGAGIDKDLSGNKLPNAPPFTVSAGAQYTVPLSSDWAGTFRADYYWQDYSWARVFNDDPYDRLRGYTNVNLALIFTSQNGWQVMLYDKNVFNTTAITGTFLNSDDSGLTTNVFLTDPKLIGIRVTKNW